MHRKIQDLGELLEKYGTELGIPDAELKSASQTFINLQGGCSLQSMETLPTNGEPAKGMMYIGQIEDNNVSYIMKNSAGEIVEGNFNIRFAPRAIRN